MTTLLTWRQRWPGWGLQVGSRSALRGLLCFPMHAQCDWYARWACPRWRRRVTQWRQYLIVAEYPIPHDCEVLLKQLHRLGEDFP